jgi:hypothetical protein
MKKLEVEQPGLERVVGRLADARTAKAIEKTSRGALPAFESPR